MENTEELFSLEEDENYEKVCGEILLTTNKRVAVHCTLCNAKYKGFEAYITHVFEEHMTPSEDLEEKPDVEEISLYNLFDTPNEFEETTLSIDMKNEPSEEEALQEEELPISMLKEPSKVIKNIKKPSPKDYKKPQVQQTVTNDDFVIPSVIREVIKRNSIIRKSAPEEERKHKCPICGLGFKEKHNMRYHFNRHSNEKNHKCPDCDKMFYTRSEVRAHRRFHTNKREYLCSDCGRAFKTQCKLTNHIKRHKNQRDFKCNYCDKAFFDNETLQSHIRVHTQERPFSCKTCYATFARTTALRNHVKLHENKRAYKCNLCEAGFNQQAGLFSHMKVTHKAA